MNGLENRTVPKERNLTIETLRGLSIILVVIGHVIGSSPEGGMKIDFPSLWRYLYLYCDYIQLPLFIAIAGWIYAYKPVGNRLFSSFIFDKVKRLLIPMAAVGTIYFLVQYLIPGTNVKGDLSNIWRIYLFPYTMFWYLQSLFLIFIVVVIADKLSLMKSATAWGFVLGASYILYLVQRLFIEGNVPNLFSFQGAIVLLPYFLVGLGVRRFGKDIYKSKALYVALAIIGMILLQVKWFYPNLNTDIYESLLPICVIPTLILIFNLKVNNRILMYFGTYSYGIYLFHGFGTSGGRIISSYLGVHSNIVVFLFAFAIAIMAPIIVDKILSKNRYTGMIFLGKPGLMDKK